jgi:hypothetical protein
MVIIVTADQYEAKAQQCLRLARSCTDPVAKETLKKLAREYELMAAALRAREEIRAASQERAYFRAVRRSRHESP